MDHRLHQWLSGATVALLAVLLCVPSVQAKKLYRYQDENGQWHFTDEEPEGRDNVQQEQLAVSGPQKRVYLINRGSRTHPRWYVVNEYHGPVEIQLTVTYRKNVHVYPRPSVRTVIPPRGDQFVMGIRAAEEGRAWQYKTSFDYAMGDPRSTPDGAFPYLPPVPAGQAYRVSQGFNGQRTHKHDYNRYAIDIVMPEGTPVVAVRAGKVMAVDQDFFEGGYEEKYRNKANQIVIHHNDGTMALYAHLALESVRVRPGETVAAGQIIGLSGNTGFSNGPHLHFAIMRNGGMKTLSMPFRLVNPAGVAVEPKYGAVLYGIPAAGDVATK